MEAGSQGEVSGWSRMNGWEDQKGKPFPMGSKLLGFGMADSQMLIYRHLLKKENKGQLEYSEEKLPRQAFKNTF